MKQIFLCCLLMLLVPSAQVRASQVHYERIVPALASPPERQLAEQGEAAFSVLRGIKLDMMEARPGERWACVTLEPGAACFLSVTFHGPLGEAALVCAGLPASPEGRIWLTAQVPNSGGYLRIAAWQKLPESGELRRHAAGLLGDRDQPPIDDLWLAVPAMGGKPSWGNSALPWEAHGSPMPGPPDQMRRADWPLAQTRLGLDMQPQSKDCAVSGSAPRSFSLGQDGACGVWELGWGGELMLRFYLPPEQAPFRAIATISLERDSLGLPILDPSLRLSLNGLDCRPIGAIVGTDLGLAWQQTGFDCSLAIVPGVNELELEAGYSLSGECRIGGIQVWVE